MIECRGVPRLEMHYTMTRAKVFTASRLLGNSAYGFYLRVTNPMEFVREMTYDWKIWTYTQREEGVDGSFTTVRKNAQDTPGVYTTLSGIGHSWAVYERKLPSADFQVTIPDLRPTVGNAATEIIVFPVSVSQPSDRNVRILAPEGFRWSFSQSQFIYRSPNSGAPASESVVGADLDF